MTKKKYLLIPGHVKSINDGDIHYISPVMLKNLYNVNMSECLIYNPKLKQPKNLIELHPREDGDYTLPEDKE